MNSYQTGFALDEAKVSASPDLNDLVRLQSAKRDRGSDRLTAVPGSENVLNRPGELRAISIHIIDPNSQSRAQLARISMMTGIHAEIYADGAEFLACNPKSGIVLFADAQTGTELGPLIAGLARQGAWLPVIAYSQAPDARAVVDSMRMGAIDYLSLPLNIAALCQAIERAQLEGHGIHKKRTQEAAAIAMVERLSPRERQVLESLALGSSNKEIARELEISPRTVEIHRMKMMAKLGVRHSAQAVRLQILAYGVDALAA